MTKFSSILLKPGVLKKRPHRIKMINEKVKGQRSKVRSEMRDERLKTYFVVQRQSMLKMQDIYNLILERNDVETLPFKEVYDSHASLQSFIRNLELKCQRLETQSSQKYLKEQVESLQDQLSDKMNHEAELKKQTIKLTEELSKIENTKAQLKESSEQLKKELEEQESAFIRLKDELSEATNLKNIAEKQYDTLKETIRRLQDENDSLQKSNDELINRIVTEKEKSMEEMMKMTELLEQANKKVEMLTALQKKQEEKLEQRRFHFGKVVSKDSSSIESHASSTLDNSSSGRQFGITGVIPPKSILQKIHAHPSQITCVRYSPSDNGLIATCSESNISIHSTSTISTAMTADPIHPQKQPFKTKTLRGPSNQIMLSLDISSSSELIAGASSDKTCRIWNIRTERLVHQLVGHNQKVTAVKFLHDDSHSQKSMIVTASTDRSLKLWDISRSTYRQNLTLRHGATVHCLDTSISNAIVSGHIDGGIRIWDPRSNERIGDIPDLHDASCGGVTSVMFNPSNNSQIVSMGRDSIIKLVDVRMATTNSSDLSSSVDGIELQTFQHVDMKVDLSYSGCVISPDGKYVAAGSANGNIFIWRTSDGNLENQLDGHDGVGVVSVAWGRGSSNGQQFASVDKKGFLYLWA